ncbi:MAG TPA: PVC-type heme-binding CxxCH protein, partial [Verrucomicrobiae bacterium]|nr:PVC-type heme-binding CxxCH protein [Verrucomicrobiae bacterium]
MPVLKAVKSFLPLVCGLALSFALAAHASIESDEAMMGKPIDPELAIKQFKLPEGFKVDLWAAEPKLLNPVAFCFDEQGRVYVAETFRYMTSVFDIRGHMNMYYDDLASRTVADRAAMIKKYLGVQTPLMASESEVVQLLEDRGGTGKCDHSATFADGFNTILDGIGAGVLARKGKVYYTDIPNLWLLEDSNHTGQATSRTSLSYGYGVHFGYTGHDLHGLCIGPDGKLYFSSGDRGLNVTNKEGKVLDYPDTGTVLRCNLDGSDLEVFAYGLRNPQCLAFDDYGNLFTGDNNCDHGDAARIVYVVEGGDTGWRIANQFSETTAAGVWNSEKLWELQFPGQAAYIVPPVAHMGDGPSGLAHYPGTGFPAQYKDHFFMCDFRGAPVISGVHSFALTPHGAGFDVIDHNRFWWHILGTDVKFSPDGQMYVCDWVRGWPQSGLGRLYRAYDPQLIKSPLVLETKKLIAEGMEKRPVAELQKLLEHADQRVRLEAQFELAARASATSNSDEGRKCIDALTQAALGNANQLARLHGIWGLGQVGRSSKDVLKPILRLLTDSDAEVRAQTAKILGDDHFAGAFENLTNLLTDQSLRVRFFAAQSLGKLGNAAAVKPLLAMLRENLDQDVFLRHAGVMGLLGTADKAALVEAAGSDWRSVRMAALLAMRRREMPEISMFLHDPDPLIILEAARAISDLPIKAALPDLAALIDHPSGTYMLDWRVLNANFREGDEKNAVALANYAANGTNDDLRGEAIRFLADWHKPFSRDRITGLWRPLPPRNGEIAVNVLKPIIAQLVSSAPDTVRFLAILTARQLTLT